ncbi:hypothetical protein [Streptomyces cyaneofuscatus]|uniref:hypothetical protein n=1 Tax=Streptomyces cyaneofuscatus TaxID=66883 RepID=UPI003656C3BD
MCVDQPGEQGPARAVDGEVRAAAVGFGDPVAVDEDVGARDGPYPVEGAHTADESSHEGRRVADAALTDLAAALSALVSGLTAAERDALDRALQALLRAGRGLPHERGA